MIRRASDCLISSTAGSVDAGPIVLLGIFFLRLTKSSAIGRRVHKNERADRIRQRFGRIRKAPE
jgi:hypothetical protein